MSFIVDGLWHSVMGVALVLLERGVSRLEASSFK